ncbi:hypothetical protein A1O7_02530 [Cladophialophora yegresii CBS 114405]|uniref:Uncharacterized protein n=1 Tax=Cladophialophora yegresii CBS 114405 TaxID=1182544 RepID=W9W1Z7_9EURO|nr:uncharacterized protein A1O7_02530 [Cladophialophora yegresii CBS 114405]EXJ62097.1 hypothetical protein A1O7_02530 [Cladophialophora yegresii CBS 114405]
MDRANLSNAIVAGMGLDVSSPAFTQDDAASGGADTIVPSTGVPTTPFGSQSSVIVGVFFPTYVLLQPPSTGVIRNIRPRIILPTITLLRGMTLLAFGFIRD